MTARVMILMAGAVLLVGGCATNRDVGGTGEDYDTSMSAGESSPRPAASPTFRPGMNPYDPRDAHFGTRPLPNETSP